MKNTTTADLKVVTLWKSYVGRGAPSNACGSRVGYGVTKEDASERAGHYNNQAPWEKFARVPVFDFAEPKSLVTESERVYHSLDTSDFESTPQTREAARLADKGRYASAVLVLLGK